MADREKLFNEQDGKCFYCGKELPEYWHADHKTPKSRGGSSKQDNFVAACEFCNLSKHYLTFEEFRDKIKERVQYLFRLLVGGIRFNYFLNTLNYRDREMVVSKYEDLMMAIEIARVRFNGEKE